jgi:flagellar biosynthesis protein FliP
MNSLGNAAGGDLRFSSPLEIALLLTALTLLPAAIAAVTPFLRISLVLHFLRQALGTQTAPSNQVLLGLSLFLTMIVMRPVLKEVQATAIEPYQRRQITLGEAWERAQGPWKSFLLRSTREKDIRLFLEITKSPAPAKASDTELDILLAAYVLSELKAGFQIGAVLFLPFLVIDLVAASVTLTVGMVQLPPVMISAPFKILLFTLVDGWNLVIGSLVKSFG